MLVGEVGAFGVWVRNSAVSDDRLWQRPLGKISDMEIHLFYARQGLKGMRDEAIDAISRLQAACVTLSFHGDLDMGEAATVIMHEPPDPRFMVDELIDGLVKLTPARRHAVLFDLECAQLIGDSHTLVWDQILPNRGALTRLAREVLAVALSRRNLKLPYVFWEWATPTIAGPLLHYRRDVEAAFGMNCALLQARYSGMIMIDRRAESTSLLQLAADLG